jgi:MFS family permease
MAVMTAAGVRSLERTTLRLDMLRSIPYGFTEAAAGTLFLLIAVKALDAGSVTKSLIAGASNAGLLFSPLIVTMAARRGGSVTRVGSFVLGLGAGVLCLALFGHSTLPFTVGSVVGLASVSAVIPLMTVVYLHNYPAGRRGRSVSLAFSVRVTAALVTGLAVGRLLDVNLGAWRWVVVATVVAIVLMALAMWQMTTEPLPPTTRDERAWKRRLDLLRTDRLVRNTLNVWMLAGFANLMMIPLRVEYLGSGDYGVVLSPGRITLLTIVIPSVVRLLTAPLFGWVFDRMPFFVARVLVNVLFAASIAIFFMGSSWTGLVVGSVLLGLAGAGGDILWNLWATKFTTTAQQAADVMSLHTFSTGIRGIIAPFVAYWMVSRVSPTTLAFFCAALMAGSSLLLVRDLRDELAGRRIHAAAAR